MKKLIFISPGKSKPIKDLGDSFDNIELIYINWKYKTISDLVEKIRPKIDSDFIGGYSIGGTIALILANELRLKKLILYSPTPLFKEEVKTLSKSGLRYIGKKRLSDTGNYSVREIISNIKIPIDIYIGSEEVKSMANFANYLHKNIKNSSLIVKKGRHHGNLIK